MTLYSFSAQTSPPAPHSAPSRCAPSPLASVASWTSCVARACPRTDLPPGSQCERSSAEKVSWAIMWSNPAVSVSHTCTTATSSSSTRPRWRRSPGHRASTGRLPSPGRACRSLTASQNPSCSHKERLHPMRSRAQSAWESFVMPFARPAGTGSATGASCAMSTACAAAPWTAGPSQHPMYSPMHRQGCQCRACECTAGMGVLAPCLRRAPWPRAGVRVAAATGTRVVLPTCGHRQPPWKWLAEDTVRPFFVFHRLRAMKRNVRSGVETA
mmetsp:Transcript_8556/g.25191  ORF Transcript_8556/g.25191 Transcript_8556/m.25191 type:complete len:270 (+) Transcript_8556:269-1078(+)